MWIPWKVASLPALALLAVGTARGQGPTIPPATRPGSTSGGSILGTSPGSLSGGAGGGSDAVLGGRPGPSVPRVPSSITRPDRRPGVPLQEGIAPPPAL